MPRTCTVCNHPMREYIEEAIVRGEPFRNIAERFGLSGTAVHRHKQSHLPELLSRAREEEDVELAQSLYEQLEALQRRALDILSRAEREGELKTALQAVRELRGLLQLAFRVGAGEEVEVVDE